jgi:Ca2+-binding RTX toxin-like protein
MAIKRRKFRFEQLESRKMRAADIAFNGGIVDITGTDGDDFVEVRFDDDDIHIELTYPDDDGSGTDDIDRRYDIEDVTQIRFHGGDGDDEMVMFIDELDNGVTLNHIYARFYGEGDNDTFDNQTNIRSYIYGGEGDDTLLGGSSYDYIYGDQGNDTLNGREGNDYYYFTGANLGSDTIAEVAGQGVDTINLYGLTLTNNTDWDYTFLDLGATYEQYVYWAQNGEHFKLTLSDGEAIENAYGTNAVDYMMGNGQNNTLYGYGGDDWLFGYGGDDYLYGVGGNDFLWGMEGSDRLYGGNDQDVLFGDEVNWDLYYAYAGAQDADGQIDINTLMSELMQEFNVTNYKLLDDAFHTELAADRERLPVRRAGLSLRRIRHGSGLRRFGRRLYPRRPRRRRADRRRRQRRPARRLFVQLQLSPRRVDFLFGMGGNDNLYGRGGDDWLFGGDGLDNLEGHEGNDVLYGRHDDQADNMNGGSGSDMFVRYFYDGGGYGWTWDAEENEEDFTSGEDYVGYVYL